MLKLFSKFKQAGRQTKWLIVTATLYLFALAWTTIQAYARLEYSRSAITKPIIFQAEEEE